MFEKVLTVCTGNLCRSPMAEAWLAHKAGERPLQVRSAGLSARAGIPAHESAVALLSKHGVDLSAHRARQIEEADILGADLVLVMEHWQKDSVEQLCPAARGRTYLLAHWQGEQEIPDPMGGSPAVFDAAFEKINVAVDAWLERIS